MKSIVKSWFRAVPAGEVGIAGASEPKEPSLSEVLLMFAVVFALHLLMVCRVSNFWDARTPWFDGGQYLEVAAIIRQGNLWGHEMPKPFWGFPYAIAGISKVLAIPGPMALVLISILGSLATCILVHRLYGGWVAATFIFINYEWIQLSVEGGSEPLFMCLLLASFLAARSGRWNLAALLASLSTTVRPVGVLALLGFALALAWRRSYRQLAIITLIGLAIGVLYVVPLWIILGSPFANLSSYRMDWEPHGWLLTYPFGALVSSYLLAFHETRWTHIAFSPVWLLVTLVGMVAMWLPRNRQRFSAINQPEALFASVYTFFLVSFNAADYMAIGLTRYVFPILPLLLFSLRDWIPRGRRVLWVGALLSALVASAGIVGFKNVFGFKLP
jgi:hypothetical protein